MANNSPPTSKRLYCNSACQNVAQPTFNQVTCIRELMIGCPRRFLFSLQRRQYELAQRLHVRILAETTLNCILTGLQIQQILSDCCPRPAVVSQGGKARSSRQTRRHELEIPEMGERCWRNAGESQAIGTVVLY